ncbi:MAG: leucine dehydrogenase [Minwuiales bacterium]|nr:leucine dehydrogenase [Minwuiales bacterium]
MAVFRAKSFDNHETVVFCHDRDSGLKAIIAVHDTTLGPALGGCRMWPYASEEEALDDVLRLSRGMTYKSAISGIDHGGGKSVIIGDSRTDKTDALFEALGRFVNDQGGQYIVAEDVGTSVPDMEIVRRTTRHVAGIAEGGVGDPSPATAWGVFHGIRAAVRHKLGRDNLNDVKVAVQGLGHVGIILCQHLAEAGAKLIVSDLNDDAVRSAQQKFGATACSADAIYDQNVDVFAPCALGAVINDDTLPRIKAQVIAGSANNQLAEDRHGQVLADRGILYAPDYVINAGGIIVISHEGAKYDKQSAFDHVAGIYETLDRIFIRSAADGQPPNEIADRMAEERIAKIRADRAEGPTTTKRMAASA